MTGRPGRWVSAGLAVALLVAAAPVAAASGAAESSARVVGTQQVLFRGGTAGYGCFRIPALVRTTTGSLLAFAEARESPSCADRGDIDVVVRRSTNDGRTWGPIRTVLSGSPDAVDAPFTRGNPTPVVDETTGDIVLVTTSNPATPGGQRLPWVQRSSDDGVTFSAAEPIAASFDDGAHNGWFATGPGHGVQLRAGEHAGRLVVGAHQKPADGSVRAGVLYSDDGGRTWQASAAADSHQPGALSPGEISVAELPGGGLYAAARNEIATGNHRAKAVSTDGGTSMPTFVTVPSLVTPNVQGAVLALRATYQRTPGDTLLFTGPSDATDRKLLRVRYSTDNGNTWTSAGNGLVNGDRAGYSDVAELADGEIGVLYEGGASFSADEIRFNRFTPAQIGLPGTFTGSVSTQPSQPAGPTTPDATPEANDAYLAGNAALSNPVGQGLVLDGAGDYADLPYARGLDPGAGDFTATAWFRYSATAGSPDQALLWAYGAGANRPQVWVRAQPGQDQVLAWVQGSAGAATVAVRDTATSAAFGDGAWHHLALVRSGGQIRLTVDGTRTATATGVAGSVTARTDQGVTGIRLGAKQDGTASDAWHGGVNDFRFYRRALTDAELAGVRQSGALASDAALGVRLPFQVIDTATAPTRTTVAITDDVSGHCAAGTLLGGHRSLVDGRVAGSDAIRVDADHPGVEVGFTPTLDLGADDFTITAWFRYSATASSPTQALVWAFGSTAGKRSLWVRAQPGQDRLYAWVQTDTAQVGLALPDSSGSVAFGDNAWHLLSLTRSGGQVRLGVDAGTPATATGLTGSVTAAKADAIQGLRVGSKPDGTDVFQGSFDETRVYRRALSTDEVTRAATGSFPAGLPALWWTFDLQHTQAHDVVRPTPASGPSTPDSSVHCANAYVRGGATLTGGPAGMGSALSFDGTDDAVQLPHDSASALGSGDFTITTWLRYSATPATGDQVLLWAYGVGGTERSLWLRAQPGQDRLYAWLQTDAGATGLAAPDPSAAAGFGDGGWHHVALRRSADTLALLVDGVVLASTTLPAGGSLTYGDTFAVDGVQLGAKPDGTNRLRGALDEFRIVRTALDADALAALRQHNPDLGPVTAVHLSFESIAATSYAGG